MAETWRKLWTERPKAIKDKMIEWRRKEQTIQRIDKPSRLDKARRLGYKSKQGFVVVRIRVSKGGMRKRRPSSGRRPKHLGVTRIKANISMQKVAENRVARKFPNMKVLNSYYVIDDGKHYWYEAILVDPNHPVIKNDADLAWLMR